MEKKGRLKVVYICHFSNELIRHRLCLNSYRNVNILRKYIGVKPKIYEDFAPWVSNILYQSPNYYKELDTYVISPHKGMKRSLEEFQDNGIHYSFYKSRPSRIFLELDKRIFKGRLVSYKKNRKVVESLIRQISPDIIVLIGTENPYYSSTVLDIDGIPIFILCQTVFNNPEHKCGYDEVTYFKRSSVENLLINKTEYCGVYNDKHKELLRKNGYKGYIFNFYWPSGKPYVADSVKTKQFDFINFANGMSWNKGYHDCINALAIVKRKYPNIQLALVDKGPESVKKELIQLIEKNNLSQNITFIPFFEKKTDLLQFLHNVRFAVLPCKVDHISGTMHQAMGQGLPLVVYETTGTPSLNKDMPCVLIAKMNDIDDLAAKMTKLMDDDNLVEELSKNALSYMAEYRKSNEGRMGQLLCEYKSIYDHYYNGKSIPLELIK